MKAKKLFLPFVMLGLSAALGMAACTGTPANTSKGGETSQQPSGEESEVEEVEITITAKDGVKEIMVGETLQLTASVEGVKWSSRATEIATVDQNGLVTAVKDGSVKIRAEKEGFKTGSFTLTVKKAPEREAKVTLRMEDCDHYSPNDGMWGMNYGGTWYGPGDGTSPVEDNNGATADGTSIGWLQQGCKETLTFTCDKAVEVEIGVTMAYANEVDLSTAIAVKFNNVAISMDGRVVEGAEDGSSYYEFHTVSFGKVNLVAGNNVLEIEMIGQGPNMDEFKIFTDQNIAVTVVKPVVLERITVDPTSVTLDIGGTQQITTATAGVTYASSDATIATVSATGLITAVAAGNCEVTVNKDGMRGAKVAVRVKAPANPTKTVTLVAGQKVRAELEDGSFYCEQGFWGVACNGQFCSGPNETGETPIEENDTASGGKSLGYFNQTSSVTLKISSPKAGNVAMVLGGASAADFALEGNMKVTINGVEINLAGKTITGGGENNYYDWQAVELGSVAFAQGENTLVIEILASQGPNLDYIDLTLAA